MEAKWIKVNQQMADISNDMTPENRVLDLRLEVSRDLVLTQCRQDVQAQKQMQLRETMNAGG